MGVARRATTEIDTATDNDAQAVFERSQKLQTDILTGEEADNLYRGQVRYAVFEQKKERESPASCVLFCFLIKFPKKTKKKKKSHCRRLGTSNF